MPAYMVQGFFFQERESLGVAMKPIEGAVAVIKKGMFRDMFAGMIWWDDSIEDWMGHLDDAFGPSTLESIHLSAMWFGFEKRYDRGSATISYEFSLEGSLWVGHYRGDAVGEGGTNCILIPVPKGMFENPLSRATNTPS